MTTHLFGRHVVSRALIGHSQSVSGLSFDRSVCLQLIQKQTQINRLYRPAFNIYLKQGLSQQSAFEMAVECCVIESLCLCSTHTQWPWSRPGAVTLKPCCSVRCSEERPPARRRCPTESDTLWASEGTQRCPASTRPPPVVSTSGPAASPSPVYLQEKTQGGTEPQERIKTPEQNQNDIMCQWIGHVNITRLTLLQVNFSEVKTSLSSCSGAAAVLMVCADV